MIERLAQEVLADDYFISLYSKANKLLAAVIFSENGHSPYLTKKELKDILRFADILSNSKSPDARNRAYSAITLLNQVYHADPYYKTFAHSVLAKLGNFPGITYLRAADNNAELPYERELEKNAKEFLQSVPDAEGLVFTDAQFELYQKISVSKCFSFSGPTSMGKSFIIKSFIRKAITNSPPENIVIMVPTRALINQFALDLNRELKETLGYYNYKIATNSNAADSIGDKQQQYLLVLTPERFLSYLSQVSNPLIGYLFVDEAHKLAAQKDARSITAYNAIAKAMRINPSLNLYFASPNVSNPEVFLKLFKKDENKYYRTIESPVSQNLFFIDLVAKKITHHTDMETYEFTPAILERVSGFQDMLQEIGSAENNIVYCSSRYQAVDKALNLFNNMQQATDAIKEVNISKEVKRAITQIKGYIHKDYYLADFLSKGIAYHFGNLPQIIRNKVEDLFKQSRISYLFCTSTLLEGVNLPAKNVFILNDKNGRNTLEPIDFWNLAGRAGRLKYELSGNIFCVRENIKDWKHVELLNKKIDISLNPSIENHIDRDLKKIEEMLRENPDIKTKTETLRKILAYIANIISIDTLEIERSNYQSAIIEKLIAENKQDIIALAKNKTQNITIPTAVLNANQSVKISIQDDIFQRLRKASANPGIKLPNDITYETCKQWLHTLYEVFQWKTEEKDIKSEAQLDYYAALMNQWINGLPLSSIINQSIDYYHDKNKEIQIGFTPGERESFSKLNKRHVNVLIGNIIEDIEKILRFLFEKYFNTYYTILVEVVGEANAGPSWATFLEYGTRNSIVIALQNYGLSRHSANYLYKRHSACLTIEGDKLISIDLAKLNIMLNRDDIEYDEIHSILF